MKRSRAWIIAFAFALVAAGCSRSSHHNGGVVAEPSPSPPASPEPSPPQSPGAPPSASPGPTPTASTLAIIDVRSPRALQPGEGRQITWATVSDASVTNTFVRWGTASGQLTQTTPVLTTETPGKTPVVQNFTAPRVEGTVFFAIEATDSSGSQVTSPERSIQILFANPPGAILAGAKPELAIPDGSANGVDVPIASVDSGTVATLRVRVDVKHPRRGDLAMSIVSPSGRSARLLVPSSDPNADVYGTFGDTLASADDLDARFAGDALQGTWHLRIADTVGGEVGTIHSALLLAQLQGPPGGESLPNIVTMPLTEFSIGTVGAEKALRFSYTAANLGAGPFDIHGVKDDTGTLRAFQRIYAGTHDADGKLRWVLVREKLVGQMFFDVYDKVPHFLYNQFAQYELLDASWNLIRTSDKISFCIDDVGVVDATLPNFSPDRVYWCGIKMQGLSIGWADTYAAACDRQWMKITDLPDGEYYVVAEATHSFDESGPADRIDNDAATRISIVGNTVTVLEQLDGPTLAARRAAAAGR